MASDAGVESGLASLKLTSQENGIYRQLFQQADSDNVGVVTGEVAVKFFEKTQLDSRVLGEIWRIADRENRGFLTLAGFAVALRLIAHAQAGRPPSQELTSQPSPLPQFDGVIRPPNALVQSPTGLSLAPQITGVTANRFPPLTPERVAQYIALFDRQELHGNALPGDKARAIFLKSNLPSESLHRIWQLADTERRGSLVLVEFIIAMHLLNATKTGALRALPNILPAAFYEAATRWIPANRQSSAGVDSRTAIPQRMSDVTQAQVRDPLRRPTFSPRVIDTSGDDWLISPAEKARFDQLFDEIDENRRNILTGDVAVNFLRQSDLAETILASIWDLADVNCDGCLNRDEFAVAMYLIRQQRLQRDPSVTLPATLPANLVPPSMRGLVRPLPASSIFDAPPPQLQSLPQLQSQPQAQPPRSALDDLLSLDIGPIIPTPAPHQEAFSTGGSNRTDPFSLGVATIKTGSPLGPTPIASTFKPFVPASSFGKGLSTQVTGDSTVAPLTKSPPPLSVAELGDIDPEVNKKLSNETSELANLSNQVGSLSKQMQDVQSQRISTQTELSQATAQKSKFEQRLRQLRTLYEKEARDSRALEEQLVRARSDTQKAQMECASLQSSYEEIQNQHQLVLVALQADQQENAALRERIRGVGGEITQLKAQVDRLRSEARQQRGLAAINKKQVLTSEAEREKLRREVEELSKPADEAPFQVATNSTGSSGGVTMSSSTPSAALANNPFFRRTGSTDMAGSFTQSPKASSDRTLDDLFGPSFSLSENKPNIPPPPTTFTPHHTGTSSGSPASYFTPPPSLIATTRQPTSPTESAIARDPHAPGSNYFAFTESASKPDKWPTEHIAPSSFASANGQVESDLPTDRGTPDPLGSAGGMKAFLAPEGDSLAAADSFKAKEEFDVAFASFNMAKKGRESRPSPDTVKSLSNFSSEFPPISELEKDGKSDYSSDDDAGFDDDFAPMSPAYRRNVRPHHDSVAVAHEPVQSASPASSGEGKEGSGALTPRAESSAPFTSDETEFPDAEQMSASPSTPSKSKGVPSFGSLASFGSMRATASPFHYTDDEFDGLEDAKEGSADDDFATISRPALDEFGPVFDGSPSSSQDKVDSKAYSTDSGYDFMFNSPPPSVGSSIPPAKTAAEHTVATPTAAAESHDWDALFANLDPAADPGASIPTPTASSEQQNRTPTQGVEPDDPLLGKLTSMGYQRPDAVLALEKFNYSLERAANYLASQSPPLSQP